MTNLHGQDPKLLTPVAGRLTGPTATGHFLASYVLAHGDGFFGYSKVCLTWPRDLWSCKAIRKVSGPIASSPSAALANAEKVACNVMRTRHPPYDITFGTALLG